MSASATPCPTQSHPLDHLELLLLDGAVTRLIDRYLSTHSLSSSQRQVLGEYSDDVREMAKSLFGPAREYAEQLVALARTILDATAAAAHPATPDASYAA